MSKEKFSHIWKGIKFKELGSDPSDNKAGSVWYNGFAGRLKGFFGGAIREVATTDQSQVFSNKTVSTESNLVTHSDVSKVAIFDASGNLTVSPTVDTSELSQLDGVSSNIQTQFTNLDNRVTDIENDYSDDVEGPASSTDTAIARFDGITGQLLQDSNVTVDDLGNVVTTGKVSANEVEIDESFILTELVSAPSTPVAGLKKLYAKTDDLLYMLNSAGEEVPVGSGAGEVKATFIDPVTTVLPTGTTVTIDGVIGVDGDTVLYTNLVSNNNRIYELSGVGVSLVWTPLKKFNNDLDPVVGDSVRAAKGDAFASSVAFFDGTIFKVNDTIRLFDGVSGNFWELGSIKSVAIANNTTDDIFAVSVAGSENFIVSYSLVRGLAKETGEIFVTTDGTNVSVTTQNSAIGVTNVTFSGVIDTGDIKLQYTSNNSTTGSMKYFVKRWSDSAGGPTGIPNYSGATSGASAGGVLNTIQFHDSGGVLNGDSKLKWDAANSQIDLNGMGYKVLSGSITINDNQIAPANLVSYSAATYRFVIIDYSIERGSEFRVGTIFLASSNSESSFNDSQVETGTGTGVTLSDNFSAGTTSLQYTSTSTGNTGVFKYTIRRWS
jgi:hypothetical protein